MTDSVSNCKGAYIFIYFTVNFRVRLYSSRGERSFTGVCTKKNDNSVTIDPLHVQPLSSLPLPSYLRLATGLLGQSKMMVSVYVICCGAIL